MSYKTTRANKMRSRNGQPRSGHCVECGRLTNEAMGGKRVTIPSQTNGVWVCSLHRGKNNLNGYSDENRHTVGTATADGITMSVELESMGCSTHARAYLIKNNFMATSDCTVDIEYKSPIYYSECPISKIVGGVEYMDKNPNYRFSVNNENCGIHTHFGFIDNHFDFTTLDRHYEELFKPLCDAVDSLTDSQRKSIFGRSYERYASRCNFNYPERHENWINIQHRYTLEIRLPRFYSADAYMRFVKCFKKIFKALNTHYISKLHNDANAKKAGRKMAMVFKKEYNEYFMSNIATNDNNSTIITHDNNIFRNDVSSCIIIDENDLYITTDRGIA